MAYLTGKRTMSNLIEFTSSGIDIATFAQVRDAITTRYKEVYGQDIDLTVSPANADGVFVNDLALIINNILQSMRTLYANLDVNTASGIYLDRLCRLSNITRKAATQSNAYIEVLNIGSSAITIYPKGMTEETVFVDVSGTEWLYEGTMPIAIDTNRTQSIQVFAREAGAIAIPANSINQAIAEPMLVVTQPTAGNIGEDDETDAELRARRAQSTGATGTTVLEALSGALLELSTIKDVKIYNNNTNLPKTVADGTSVAAHSVYIVLRMLEGVDVSDQTVGKIIVNKLTPGIGTNATTDTTTGDSKSAIIQVGSTYSLGDETVYWKVAKPVTSATIEVSIKKTATYSNTTDTLIKQAIVDYLNALKLGEVPVVSDAMFAAMTADPSFNGLPTYIVTGVTGLPDTNTDTYYNISTNKVQIIGG